MIRLEDFLAANPQARVVAAGADTFPSFAFDSRLVQPGQLFMAVRTAKGDGHEHIAAAVAGGAGGVLCERLDGWTPPPGLTVLLVPDTAAAVQAHAAAIIRRRDLPVVAVTGSAGKTSVKEFIAHVLGARYRVFRNPGNFNDSYGLPIALGFLEDRHEILVPLVRDFLERHPPA